MRRCTLLLVLALLALAFAPAPLPKPVKKPKIDPLRIQGRWTQVGSPTVTLVVTDTRMEYHNRGGAVNGYDLTFDAAKAPKTYDILRGGNLAFLGIYRVEGRALTLSYRSSGNPRPTVIEEANTFKEVFRLLSR